ncbi:MAG: tyrosine-type recombinase/integrase [Candidatus Micrarchaeota archaeon]
MAAVDIYNLPRKLERYVERIKQEPTICDSNREAILKFFDYCFANGLSTARVLIYAQRLLPIAKLLGKDFKEATKDDIQALVGEIERKAWSPWTKHFYKVTLKKFYKWLEGNDEFSPDKVKWIKGSVKNSQKMLPEELLSYQDILKMIEAAPNARDKCLIAVLFESGCRISELAGVKIKHVSFDAYGAQLLIAGGKTGARRVRLITSVNLLKTWLDYNPWKTDPEASLWPRLTNRWKGQPLRYQVIRQRIVDIAKTAGVTKRVNPHSFRHARATQLAKMGLSEIQMTGIMGWVVASRQCATYVHMSMRDTDNTLLKAHGIEVKDDNCEFICCPRCSKQNTLNLSYCGGCGMPLNMKAAVSADAKTAELEKNLEWLRNIIENDESIRNAIADKRANQLKSSSETNQ